MVDVSRSSFFQVKKKPSNTLKTPTKRCYPFGIRRVGRRLQSWWEGHTLPITSGNEVMMASRQRQFRRRLLLCKSSCGFVQRVFRPRWYRENLQIQPPEMKGVFVLIHLALKLLPEFGCLKILGNFFLTTF